jgi:hypothetical protein
MKGVYSHVSTKKMIIQERNHVRHPGRSCSCPRRRDDDDDDDDDGGTGNRCSWCRCGSSTVTCPFWKGITTLLQMWMMILGIVVVVRLLLHKNDSLVVVVVGASRTDSPASNRSCRNWPLEHHYHMDDDDDLHRSLTRKLVVARPVANCCVGCQSPFHHRCHDGSSWSSSCVGATMKCSRRHWTGPNRHREVDRDGPPTLEARAPGSQ